MAQQHPPKKPPFASLREFQRQYLQLRWDAICARGDRAFYSRSIDTHVVTYALGPGAGAESLGVEGSAQADGSRKNPPSNARNVSPILSARFLFFDAATCGLLSRRRKFTDFGDGMLAYNAREAVVEYYPESASSYRSRRLAIGIALTFLWLFLGLIAFWVWRDVTGSYPRLTVPPYGSGSIHLILCLGVVLTYVIGNAIVPHHATAGLREGALPSLLPLVLQTSNAQFMSSYAWSSRYVSLVRTLSTVLSDCWLDVRELTPGDRVTQEIAHAAATVRCLIIFFSYEYMRSVNCTLEFLTALRYRCAPQRTILLLEELEPGLRPARALTVEEARAIAVLLEGAIPGLVVVSSVGALIDALDRQCVRAVDDEGISMTIEWWARNGRARASRVKERIRVVPPLLHGKLRSYRSYVFSCRRRRRGDVAGGFALLRGDGSSVKWFQPPDAAMLTMAAVIFAEALVYAHMFVYCAPDVDAKTVGVPAFEGSCLPTSIFNYLVSLLPLLMVVLQFFVNMRPDAGSLHDDILLPLNVAAHSTGLRAILDRVDKDDEAALFPHLLLTVRSAAWMKRPDAGKSGRTSMTLSSARSMAGSSSDGFSLVFVTSPAPIETFAAFARNVSDFVANRAIGLPATTVTLNELPASARRLAIYVFLLDSPESVDAFYRRVHCAAPIQKATPSRATGRMMIAYPTCQIVVVCHASVLRTVAPSQARRRRSLFGAASRDIPPPVPSKSESVTLVAQDTRPEVVEAGDRAGRASIVSHVVSITPPSAPPPPLPPPPPPPSAPPVSAVRRLEFDARGAVLDSQRSGGTRESGTGRRTLRSLPHSSRRNAPAAATARRAPWPPFARSHPPHASPSQGREKADLVRSGTAPTMMVGPALGVVPTPPPPPLPSLAEAPSEAEPEEARPALPPTAVAPASRGAKPGDASRPRGGTSARGAWLVDATASPPGTALDVRASPPGTAPRTRELRARWRRALKAAVRQLPRHRMHLALGRAPPVAQDLPITGSDGCLSPHLRAALFEYLLILTGSKAGVDPSSPYDSLAEALLDSVGRKVGAVLEARSYHSDHAQHG